MAPLEPVALAVDYSRSWTNNVNLDEPVNVNVAGIRIIKRIPTRKKRSFFGEKNNFRHSHELQWRVKNNMRSLKEWYYEGIFT